MVFGEASPSFFLQMSSQLSPSIAGMVMESREAINIGGGLMRDWEYSGIWQWFYSLRN